MGIQEKGSWGNKEYAHILPRKRWKMNLWEGIRQEAVDYFQVNKLTWHTDKHNLRSSQVLCVNIFFPFKDQLSSFNHAFKHYLPNFSSFVPGSMEFEFVDKENLLCEKSGAKTSVDVKLEWTDHDNLRNLLLLEFKFTEQRFGKCNSARNDRDCDKARQIIEDPLKCYLTSRGIRYWELISKKKGPIKQNELCLKGACPFRYDFYQLMRNQLLAYELEKNLGYDKVIFGVLFPRQNMKIQEMGRNKENPIEAWYSIIKNKNRFVSIHLENMIAELSHNNPYIFNKWRVYLRKKHCI